MPRTDSRVSEGAETLILWPNGVWGGFKKDYVPDQISQSVYIDVDLVQGSRYINIREFKNKILLIIYLLFRINEIKDFSKIAYVNWCMSQQPYCMYMMIHDLDGFLNQVKDQQPTIRTLFYPFEFYPESKICYLIASKQHILGASAQHMKWTRAKLKNFYFLGSHLQSPGTLFISRSQDSKVFRDENLNIKETDYVGRYDSLIQKNTDVCISDSINDYQIFTSGAPYDVFRGFLFASRLRKQSRSVRLVLHPGVKHSMKLILNWLCFIKQIDFAVGFNGIVSASVPTFTSGTSLYASFKSQGVRVKNIGGMYSQF